MIMEPERTLPTSLQLVPSLDVEDDVASSPSVAELKANITQTFSDVADSVQNTVNLLPNITYSFPNDALKNISDAFANMADSFLNITDSFPNIVNSSTNTTDFFRNNLADNIDTAIGIVGAPRDTELPSDIVTDSPFPGSNTSAMTKDMISSKPDVTKVLQNGSTLALSTLETWNSSVLPIPKFNLTTVAPTKEPMNKMTTLLAKATTAIYNDSVSATNATPTSESICGSGYTVDECDFVVNFESILSPILMILIVIGIIANVYIVYTVIVRKDMRTLSNLFMTNLSVTHLIYLVSIGATDVYDYVLTVRDIAHTSIIPSSVHLYITLVVTNCDVSMLTALSIDRYVAISVDPKKLDKYSKGKIATGTCVLVWIASLAVCAPIFYGVDTTNGSFDISESSFKVAMAISFVVSYIIPLIVITVVYFAIRRKLRKRGGASMKVKKGGVMVTRTPAEYRLYHDQQILRGILVIILLYTFNFGARYITKMILYLSIPFGNIAIFVARQLSEVAAILTASLQPIVYVALHPTFSKHTREKFACSGGAKSLGCCTYCGMCYIACCTCCGLMKLSPLPQPSMKVVGESGQSAKKIDKVILVENMELEIVPPPPSPTSRNPSPPPTVTSPPLSSSLSHLPNSSSSPPTSSSPPSSPAYIHHTSSPSFSPSHTLPNHQQTSPSPSFPRVPSPPSYPPPSPPHSPSYPDFLFFPSPKSSSPPCLECEEP